MRWRDEIESESDQGQWPDSAPQKFLAFLQMAHFPLVVDTIWGMHSPYADITVLLPASPGFVPYLLMYMIYIKKTLVMVGFMVGGFRRRAAAAPPEIS